MPNWCENTLVISGPPDQLSACLDANMGLPANFPPQFEWEKEEPIPVIKQFCFNALVPVPPPVLEVGFCSQKAGELDGYNWCCTHWGTKWDIYFDDITKETIGWVKGCRCVALSFNTAYDPPRPWFKELVKKFPELQFMLHYEECGAYIAGDLQGINGIYSSIEYNEEQCDRLFAKYYSE